VELDLATKGKQKLVRNCREEVGRRSVNVITLFNRALYGPRVSAWARPFAISNAGEGCGRTRRSSFEQTDAF